MSSKESEDSLRDDEVNSRRSDALKLYSHQRGSSVSGSKQELVASMFTASEFLSNRLLKKGSQPLGTRKLHC